MLTSSQTCNVATYMYIYMSPFVTLSTYSPQKVCIHAYTHVHTYTRVHTHTCTHTHTHVHTAGLTQHFVTTFVVKLIDKHCTILGRRFIYNMFYWFPLLGGSTHTCFSLTGMVGGRWRGWTQLPGSRSTKRSSSWSHSWQAFQRCS